MFCATRKVKTVMKIFHSHINNSTVSTTSRRRQSTPKKHTHARVRAYLRRVSLAGMLICRVECRRQSCRDSFASSRRDRWASVRQQRWRRRRCRHSREARRRAVRSARAFRMNASITIRNKVIRPFTRMFDRYRSLICIAVSTRRWRNRREGEMMMMIMSGQYAGWLLSIS